MIFTGTDDLGVYEVTQSEDRMDNDKEYFAVNFPSSESDVAAISANTDGSGTSVKKSASADLDLKNIIIVIILALMVAEWIAYLRK